MAASFLFAFKMEENGRFNKNATTILIKGMISNNNISFVNGLKVLLQTEIEGVGSLQV